MLQRTLSRLYTRVEADRVVPLYLSEQDEPWLRALLNEHARFVGRKRAELKERLREPLPVAAPKAKLSAAIHVLEGMGRDRAAALVPPREARARLFRAAAAQEAAQDAARPALLESIAASFGVTSAELAESLFADLKSEQCLTPLPEELSPEKLIVLINSNIVTSFVRRAARLRITASGNTRALVRQARLLGLICVVRRAEPKRDANHPLHPGLDTAVEASPDGVVLDISGPLVLFRHTEVYGWALASLIPRVAWCNAFEIRAACALSRGKHLSTLIVRSGDPIGSGKELPAHDSRVEERFVRDFGRAATDWDIVREPHPVDANGTLIFPDFELVNRRQPKRRWLLEIVGYWTPDYLAKKFALLRAAKIDRLILCIDERRHCAEEALPECKGVIRYRSRVRPADVLAIIEPRLINGNTGD